MRIQLLWLVVFLPACALLGLALGFAQCLLNEPQHELPLGELVPGAEGLPLQVGLDALAGDLSRLLPGFADAAVQVQGDLLDQDAIHHVAQIIVDGIETVESVHV